MIKIKKTLVIILLIITFLVSNLVFSSLVYAEEIDTILQIVQASSEQKDLPDDQRIYF